MPDQPPPSLPLLLQRLADEIGRQAESVRSLHALALAPGGDDRRTRQAQTIDIASQHLDEAAAVIAALAPRLADARADLSGIAERVKLAAVRAALFEGTPAAPDERDAGDLELF